MELVAAAAVEAAISLAVEKLGNWLRRKAVFPQEVEKQVKGLQDELKRMRSFLKDAAQKQASNESVRDWISEIREVAHDAEDAIEIYILKVENATGNRVIPKSWASFHVELQEEIKSIWERLESIKISRERYGIQDLGEESAHSSIGGSEDVQRRRQLAPWENDNDVVGLDKDEKLLLEKAILDKRKGLSIAAIVGMAGIGKSTLARMVYNHPDLADRFECRAWVVVSNEFTPEDIFKQIMLRLQKSKKGKQKVRKDMKELEESTKDLDKRRREEMLQEMLHKHLIGKKYFIVLDDVWERTHWDSLRSAFPDQQDKASRLLITSRTRDVLSCAWYVHEMKILDPGKSLKLFRKKAFATNGRCPQDLENIERDILTRCGGLPLAITNVGGLLVNRRQSRSEWETVLNEIDSHLGGKKDDVLGILELSYHNLPLKLKRCFLCLSFFKKDAIIRAKKLVHIWIAEGLVPEGEGEKQGRIYLDELINRNLVQVKELTTDDQVKSCYMHDLLRKLSITKAREEIGFEILSAEVNSQSLHKPRHLALYYNGERFKIQNKRLRTSLFYGNGEHLQFKDLGNQSFWKSFKILLQVLDFEGFHLMGNWPERIGALIALRYLGLRNTGIVQLPCSLARLKKLEVLDIAQNTIAGSPDVIWELEGLRHLYVDTMCLQPPKIGNFKKINTLKYISYESDQHLNCVSQLTNLRKLGLVVSRESDFSDLYNSLARLKHFVSLSIIEKRLSERGRIPAFLRGFRVLERLTKLKLKNFSGSCLPSTSDFPPNLSYLSLINSYLNEDSIQVLKKLPNLSYLKLHGEYWGEEMLILNDEFTKLKVLVLQKMTNLREIQVEKDAMLDLRRLEIYECEDLVVRISMSTRQELKVLKGKGVDLLSPSPGPNKSNAPTSLPKLLFLSLSFHLSFYLCIYIMFKICS